MSLGDYWVISRSRVSNEVVRIGCWGCLVEPYCNRTAVRDERLGMHVALAVARLPTRSLLLDQTRRDNRKEILRRHRLVGRKEKGGVGVLDCPEVYVSWYERSVIRGIGGRVEEADARTGYIRVAWRLFTVPRRCVICVGLVGEIVVLMRIDITLLRL